MQIVDLENTFVGGLTHDDEERHTLGINVSCFGLVCRSPSCVPHLISV